MKKTSPGNAELQLGSVSHSAAELELSVPGGQSGNRPGWSSRGYLAHRDDLGLLQSLTFRLADSLPQLKLRQLEEALVLHPEAWRDLERRKGIERWLDAGLGCCALRHARMAETMEDALLHFDGKRYRLVAWCIMPNHVHVLIEPMGLLAGIVQSWKSYTGRWALAHNAELSSAFPGRSFGCVSIGIVSFGVKAISGRRLTIFISIR